MRQRNRTPRESTTAQLAAQRRMPAAAANYDNLTNTQLAQWDTYAKTLTVERRSGEKTHPHPFNVYTGLASKLQQVNPAAGLPTTPPASSFEGDTATLTAVAAGGKITFTENKANAVDVTTELLLQPLVKKTRRAYLKDYRTAAVSPSPPGHSPPTSAQYPVGTPSPIASSIPAQGRKSASFPLASSRSANPTAFGQETGQRQPLSPPLLPCSPRFHLHRLSPGLAVNVFGQQRIQCLPSEERTLTPAASPSPQEMTTPTAIPVGAQQP